MTIKELIEKLEKRKIKKESDPRKYWYNMDMTAWFCEAIDECIEELSALQQSEVDVEVIMKDILDYKISDIWNLEELWVRETIDKLMWNIVRPVLFQHLSSKSNNIVGNQPQILSETKNIINEMMIYFQEEYDWQPKTDVIGKILTKHLSASKVK